MTAFDAFGHLSAQDGQQPPEARSLPEATARDLLERFALYSRPRAYGVGDLVQWAPGLRDYRHINFACAVVVEIDRAHPDSSSEFGYTVVGVIDSGDFDTHLVDERRLEPYTGPRA